ncbi:MAG: putative porin [Bacteroidia bacterium]
MRFTAVLFTAFYFLLIQPALSMPADSTAKITVPTKVNYSTEAEFRNGNLIWHQPDSGLTDLGKVNSASDHSYQYLGVPGSPCQPMIFPITNEITTYTGNRSNDLYYISNDSVKYFTTNKKFTQVDYHSGTFEELEIEILHTQNIIKGWNAGLLFNRFGVRDFILNSDTYRSRFMLFTAYHSKSGRYSLFANARWQNTEDQLNGGIQNDSSYLNAVTDNVSIKGLLFRITDARQREKRKEFYVSQFLDFGRTTGDSSHKERIPMIRLNHSFSFERHSLTYLDATTDSSFYTNYFYGESTYDSIGTDEISNKFSLIVPADRRNAHSISRNWSIDVNAEYSMIRHLQKEKAEWNNLVAGGNIISKFDSSDWDIEAGLRYVINGRDKDNFAAHAGASVPLLSLFTLSAAVQNSTTSPDYIYTFYDSNNFKWVNDFDKIKSQSVSAAIAIEKFKFSLSGRLMTVTNPVYFDKTASPAQFHASVVINQIRLEKNFRVGSFHLDNFIVYQKADEEDVIHLPQWLSRNSLYFQKQIFNKKLLMATGFDLGYNSSYYSDDFMPATGAFYLQSTLKTGDYPRFDFFIKGKIKGARIFLKMENIFDDVIRDAYYLTPHYPQPGRVFRFGLTWRFFDA